MKTELVNKTYIKELQRGRHSPNILDELAEVVQFISTEGSKHKELEQLIKQKQMKRCDLKSGMWVECENGNRYLLMDTEYGELKGFREQGLLGLEDYAEDLSYFGNWSITKVWRYKNPMDSHEVDFKEDGLIWQRPTKTELTISQIEEKLNLEKGTLKVVGE